MADSDGWRGLRQLGVVARVRGEIIRVATERRLEPGDRLPSERELANLLEVSRPSVREAIGILQAEGRLDVRHGSGVFIVEPESQQRFRRKLGSARDTETLFDMREVLEVPAARWAAERNLPELASVREAYENLDAYTSQPWASVDFDELQRLDIIFHTRIVQASGNTLLEQTQSVIYDLVLQGIRTTLLVPGRMEQSRTDHAQILKAIENGDGYGAAAAAQAHIAGARAAALAHTEMLSRDPHRPNVYDGTEST